MKKELNIKEKAQEIAHKRAKRFHQGKNHWHVNVTLKIMTLSSFNSGSFHYENLLSHC